MRSEKIDSAKARTVKNLISNVSMSKWHNFFSRCTSTKCLAD